MGKPTSNQKLGETGEKLAQKYLEQNGYNILSTNYRSGRSELDIISAHDSVLVVTEVKSFHSKPLGVAEFRVNKRKQQQIIKGVYGFLAENPNYQGQDVRLDVIVVDFSSFPAIITHHQAAFFDGGENYY